MNDAEKAELKKQVEEALKAREVEMRPQREAEARELRAWCDRELLKREVLDQRTPKEPRVKKWSENPALLLFAGFVFTTVGGTIFGSCWQGRQNTLEQRRLTRQAVIKQKYDLKDEFIKSIAETNTAGEDVVTSFGWDHNDSRQKTEAPQRMSNWLTASRNWRTKSKVLLEDIRFRFRDLEILKLFEQIRTRRSEVGINIQNLQGRIERSRGQVLKDNTFGYSHFDAADFKDLQLFVNKLNDGGDPVSRLLKARLIGHTQRGTPVSDIFNSDPVVASQILIPALNKLISGRSLHDAEAFQNVALGLETRTLLGEKPRQPAKLLRLNRLLLQDAYPNEITKCRNFKDDLEKINMALNSMIALSKQLMQAMKNEILDDEVASELATPAPTPVQSPSPSP